MKNLKLLALAALFIVGAYTSNAQEVQLAKVQKANRTIHQDTKVKMSRSDFTIRVLNIAPQQKKLIQNVRFNYIEEQDILRRNPTSL